MTTSTKQQDFWQSDFGKNYSTRNTWDPTTMDKVYAETYGVTRTAMNNEFIKDLSPRNILEVGCNVGDQLRFLQSQGFSDIFGIEIQADAVERSKQLTKNINIIRGSAFDIPYKDKYFDLVFTSGVLIHISPKDIQSALAEIFRVSGRYIWGFEYFSEDYVEIEYHGQKDYLWKGNFAQMFLDAFPDLKLVKTKSYPYLANDKNVDVMYLLEKS
ncbi:MAG: methyltransferase domain-containing protein [bacterium]|nr:methyltransferase domain-containing protein [bacterium]